MSVLNEAGKLIVIAMILPSLPSVGYFQVRTAFASQNDGHCLQEKIGVVLLGQEPIVYVQGATIRTISHVIDPELNEPIYIATVTSKSIRPNSFEFGKIPFLRDSRPKLSKALRLGGFYDSEHNPVLTIPSTALENKVLAGGEGQKWKSLFTLEPVHGQVSPITYAELWLARKLPRSQFGREFFHDVAVHWSIFFFPEKLVTRIDGIFRFLIRLRNNPILAVNSAFLNEVETKIKLQVDSIDKESAIIASEIGWTNSRVDVLAALKLICLSKGNEKALGTELLGRSESLLLTDIQKTELSRIVLDASDTTLGDADLDQIAKEIFDSMAHLESL